MPQLGNSSNLLLKAVRTSTKDLGAHVIYGRQISNGAQLQRIEDLAPFWDKLARAKGLHRDKVRVIVTAAWPRGFHACSAVAIGRKHFVRLRTLVLRALDLEKPHANGWLQCALDHPLLDPAFFVAVSSVRDLRTLAYVEETRVALTCAQSASFEGGLSSISAVAVSRLQSLGFHVLDDGWVRDSIGDFDVLACPFAEFLARAQLSWAAIVAQAVNHRECFAGLHQADFETTRQLCQTFSLVDQGILWRVLNGSALCNDMAFHWSDDGSCSCVFCGHEDTMKHRLWDCPVTAGFRAHLPSDLVTRLSSLGSAFAVHGWVPRSPFHESWFQMLCSLPSDTRGFFPLPDGGIVDLFTDGSCLWPSEPLFRIASWSVIVMNPVSLSPTKADAQVLFAQPLPGFRQTPARAELMAIFQALRGG